MAVKHGVALPVADREPGFNLCWALLNPGAVRDFPKTCTLCLVPLISTLLRLATVGPSVMTLVCEPCRLTCAAARYGDEPDRGHTLSHRYYAVFPD